MRPKVRHAKTTKKPKRVALLLCANWLLPNCPAILRCPNGEIHQFEDLPRRCICKRRKALPDEILHTYSTRIVKPNTT